MTGPIPTAGRGIAPPSIRCPDCGVVTEHPEDIAAGYCPRCHWWTSDAALGPARRLARPDLVMEANRVRDVRRRRAHHLDAFRAGDLSLHDLIALGVREDAAAAEHAEWARSEYTQHVLRGGYLPSD